MATEVGGLTTFLTCEFAKPEACTQLLFACWPTRGILRLPFPPPNFKQRYSARIPEMSLMNTIVKPSLLICFAMSAALIAVGTACQPASNTNVNANLTVNANSTPTTVNANVSTAPTAGIAAREPDRYRATLVLTAETEGGEKTIGIPTLSA